MEIVRRSENPSLFNDLLHEYVIKHSASPRYTNMYLAGERIYPQYQDELSFALVNNKKAVAIAYLPLFNCAKGLSITSGGWYTPAPLISEDNFEKNVFDEIDRLAELHSITHVKFFIDSLVLENFEKFNFLVKYGYFDSSTSNSLVRLDLSPNDLMLKMRRAIRYDINQILTNSEFKLSVIDNQNSNYKIHEIYRELHHKCSGKITRPKNTFDAQFAQLQANEAILVGIKYKEQWVAMSYFFHFKNGVIYASSADDPEFNGYPTYHAVLWQAMTYYSEKGFKWMEMCEPCCFGPQFESYPDKKQLNISKFKIGFGGKLVPLFKGTKYYSKEIFYQDVEKFKVQFANSFFNTNCLVIH